MNSKLPNQPQFQILCHKKSSEQDFLEELLAYA